MATDVTSIIDYYTNLLIIQYHSKDKARQTIDLLMNTLLADGVYFDVLNGYNLDTAVGAQLDIIGKYVGVDRYFRGQIFDGYFALVTYDEIGGSISSSKRGFCDYADMTKSGLWLQYHDIVSTVYTLIDDDYRRIIKMKIFDNTSNMSQGEIDDFLFSMFGADVTATSSSMHIVYTSTAEWEALISVALEKDVLPRPMGVNVVY